MTNRLARIVTRARSEDSFVPDLVTLPAASDRRYFRSKESRPGERMAAWRKAFWARKRADV